MNAIRCCIACILPFGALDVVRIVHANGHVEELARTVRAADIMESHPKHVVKSLDAFVLPPNAELKKGHIYVLVSTEKEWGDKGAKKRRRRRRRRRKRRMEGGGGGHGGSINCDADRYLSEIMSEKASEGRRGRVGVWRPHLESISEVASDVS